MNKIVLTFGLISGGILSTMTAIMMPLCMNGVLDFSQGEVIGYTAMVLAFLMVFFGIRTYRQNIGGGTITFGKAFQVGILITLVTCVFYVVAWEIVYYNFIPDFEDKFAEYTITDAAIAAAQKQMAEFKELYANPFMNVAITFMEVFPVGLIVTLVSAAILRKKATPDAPSPATAMA